MIHWGAVMPTRDNRPTIGAAVRSALDQTIPSERVAVVDPRSSRQTHDRLDSHDIDVVRMEGLGSGATWNEGTDRTKSGYVYMLDDEDTLLPDDVHIMRRFAGTGARMVPKGHGGRH